MAEITAVRLRLRAPEGWSHRVQARIEDALRTGSPDEGRLVIIKRLDFGRLPLNVNQACWSAEAGARLGTIARHAVHGALPDAAQADAVWFASAAEARRLLLAELAAGRTPVAWFWRLALPDWRGEPLNAWLPRMIDHAESDSAMLVELAHAIVEIAERGALTAVVAALPATMRGIAPGAAPLDAAASSTARPAPPATAAVLRLYRRLPARLRAVLVTILGELPPQSAASLWIARLVLVSAASELASWRGQLAELANALTQMVAAVTDAESIERDFSGSNLAKTAQPPAKISGTPRQIPGERAASDSIGRVDAVDVHPSNDYVIDCPIVAVPPIEQRSAAAGLWLVIRPLHVMGIGEWLGLRPELATRGFARALLRQIAERQRVVATDPLFTLLPTPDVEFPQDMLDSWRIGLDRWLRWRIRRKLADVVTQPGWLVRHEAGVAVRFRVEQADIALRRRALDVDAGWVPWLGMTVRYHFRDQALA